MKKNIHSEQSTKKSEFFEYIIVGSGLSGLSASQELLKNNKNHIILNAPRIRNNQLEQKIKKNSSFRSPLTPKLNIKNFRKEYTNWNQKYKLEYKNFNLIQSLGTNIGGLSQYWGGNLGHNEENVLKSDILRIIKVTRANEIKADNGSLMQSDLADVLLSKNYEKSKFIKVHSPLLAIKLQSDKESFCKKCKAYYCNCDGKILQNYQTNNVQFKELHVKKIKFDKKYFSIYGKDKHNKNKKFSCKYLILACGPIVSATLLNTLQPINQNLNLNHNGLFTFPFFSYYKIKKYPLALSNLNLEIHSKQKKLKSDFPIAYTNIFPLKPQLLVKYPFLKIIPNFILNRMYVAITFMDSSFVNSKFCLKNKKIIGRYTNNFYLRSYLIFLRLINFLFKNTFSLPLTLPIFSRPGSDIHYASTLKNISIKNDISERLFIADASKVDNVVAINSTIYNLIYNKNKLRKWIKNK